MENNTNLRLALELATNANANAEALRSKLKLRKLIAQKNNLVLNSKIADLEKKNIDLMTKLEEISALVSPNSNLLLHNDHVDDVEKIFRSQEYTKLLSYTKFDIEKILDYMSDPFLLHHKGHFKIARHIIDNCKDLNQTIINTRYIPKRLIHLFCQWASSDIIQYAVNKENIDLECCDGQGFRPIHLICIYGDANGLKYIIDKGVNIDFDLVQFIEDKCYYCSEKLALAQNLKLKI